MENMKTFAVVGMVVLLALALSGFVKAAGVGSSIWKDNPQMAYPGEEGVIPIYLQNMVGSEDLVFNVEYEDNPDGIASMDKTVYDVPFGKSDVLVELKYKIPENAEMGKTYHVKLLFKSANPNVAGGIQAAPAFSRDFPIQIKSKQEVQPSPPITRPAKSNKAFIWYIVGVLVVAGLVVYFVMRKKKA